MVDRLRLQNPVKTRSYTWIIGVVIIIAVLVLLYVLYFPAKSSIITKRGMITGGAWSLSKNIAVIESIENKKMMINDKDEAVQIFVYLDGNLRMGQAVDNGSAGPSMDTGMYERCQCTSATNCTPCVPHKGYNPVINIQDTFVLEILNTPDASRQNSVSTQIYVKTQNNATYNIETFPLPPLPEQKWTMITISKQGRQLNVYFNSTLVLAKKAQNNFSVTVPTCSPVSVGTIGLSGSAAMFTYFPSHQSIKDVAARYQQQVDTRGNLNGMNVVATSNSYRVVDAEQSSIVKTLCLDLSCVLPPGISLSQLLSSGLSLSQMIQLASASGQGVSGQTPHTISKIPPIYNSLETVYA